MSQLVRVLKRVSLCKSNLCDMFLRIVSSYAKAQAYFRVMFVFKCLAS